MSYIATCIYGAIYFSNIVTNARDLGLSENIFNAVLSGLILGAAVGLIIKKSRICAILIFATIVAHLNVFKFLDQEWLRLSSSDLILKGVTFYFSILGIIGSFRYHNLQKVTVKEKPAKQHENETSKLVACGFVLSLFGIVPVLGVGLGLIAIFLSIGGLVDIKERPELFKGEKLAKTTIVLGVLNVFIFPTILQKSGFVQYLTNLR